MTASPANDRPTGESIGTIRVSQKPPSRSQLARVADMPLVDAEAKSHPFQSLYTDPSRPEKRTMVIFVRHFFCGYCQEYLRGFCAAVPPSSLPADLDVAVVGCGQADLIAFYVDATACPYPVYADPTKRLYAALGMARTLDLGPSQPDYMHNKSLLKVSLESAFSAISTGPRKAFRGGDFWQVGGEFLLKTTAAEKGSSGGAGSGSSGGPLSVETLWAHRMSNTRDHAEIPTLVKVMGLSSSASSSLSPTEKKSDTSTPHPRNNNSSSSSTAAAAAREQQDRLDENKRRADTMPVEGSAAAASSQRRSFVSRGGGAVKRSLSLRGRSFRSRLSPDRAAKGGSGGSTGTGSGNSSRSSSNNKHISVSPVVMEEPTPAAGAEQ